MKRSMENLMDLGLQFFHRACEAAVEEDRVRLAWVGLVDREHSHVVPVSYAGYGYGYLSNLHIDLRDTAFGRGPGGRAIREGRPASCIYIEGDHSYWPWRQAALARGYRSSAVLPIRRGGEIVAEFSLYSQDPYHFDVVQVMRWKHFADNISRALDAANDTA